MAREPILLEVDDEPIPVVHKSSGTEFLFRPELGSKSLVRTLGPMMEDARELQSGSGDLSDMSDTIDKMMAAVGKMLVDPDRYDEWCELDLPLGHVLQVIEGLLEAWVGRPLDSAPGLSQRQ